MISMSLFLSFVQIYKCFFPLHDWLSANEEMDTAEKIILFCFLLKGITFLPFFTPSVQYDWEYKWTSLTSDKQCLVCCIKLYGNFSFREFLAKSVRHWLIHKLFPKDWYLIQNIYITVIKILKSNYVTKKVTSVLAVDFTVALLVLPLKAYCKHPLK